MDIDYIKEADVDPSGIYLMTGATFIAIIQALKAAKVIAVEGQISVERKENGTLIKFQNEVPVTLAQSGARARYLIPMRPLVE
jgi:hypothetical protein